MIEKETKKAFALWMEKMGLCKSQGSRDSYCTYVNTCEDMDVSLKRDERVIDGGCLTELRARLSQFADAYGSGHKHSGLIACMKFVTWAISENCGGILWLDFISKIGNATNSSLPIFCARSDDKQNNTLEYVDSYDRLFAYFKYKFLTPKELYRFGIENAYFADSQDPNLAEKQFSMLINLLETGDFGGVNVFDRHVKTLHIRKYGNKGVGDSLFEDLYRIVFPHAKIVVEESGNARPKENIKKATRSLIYSESEGFAVLNWAVRVLQNYQCSHVFDNRTKNPLLFEAVWNVVLTPKVIDPFTGHETLQRWPEEFQPILHNVIRKKFGRCISQYNEFAERYREKIREAALQVAAKKQADGIDVGDFVDDAVSQWLPIPEELEEEIVEV